MNLTFKMAWRNIGRHKGKSLVIGVILFTGALLMTVGNGMISGMEKGLSANIVRLFTGDLVVISAEQEHDDVLFDFNGKPLKVIRDYRGVKQVLANEPGLKDYLPATAGMVYVFNSGTEMGYTSLLGVDIARYQKFFPHSFRISEGRRLQPGERGVLISEEARKKSYDSMDFWLLPEGVPISRSRLSADAKANRANLEIRRDLVFMGASESNTSVDIRVPVKGIINYKSLNKIWGDYGIIDIESFRAAHNYVTGTDEPQISRAERQLLESDRLDQLFAGGTVVADTNVTGEQLSLATIRTETQKTKSAYNADSGSYNLVFLKVKPGQTPPAVQRKLNAVLKAKKLTVRVVGWKDAVGTIGSMAVMIKGALNLFIMVIFFVAIIVIMNTLSMAALERISEIAMMRAVGARKGLVGRMFVYETGILSFFFGGIGIISGIGVILALNAANLTTTNELLQLVYGGDRFAPVFTGADLLLGLLELAIVTCLAVLYPLRVVGKIVPLDAITRE